MNGLIPICSAFFLAAGVTFAANQLALIPWRRNRDKHWSEQARLLYPARGAARANLWAVPAALTIAALLTWPDAQTWAFVGILSFAGAFAGTLFMDHEIFPRISMRWLLRLAAMNFLLSSFNWFVFIGAIVLMPRHFNARAYWIGGGVIALGAAWSLGGSLWLRRKIGIIAEAPERLRRITADVSARMNVPFRKVLLIRSPIAQAYAYPNSRRLLFTGRLLEISSDEEVAAICAHELGHLSESWYARYARYIGALPAVPWLFVKPLIYTFGIFGLVGLGAISAWVPQLYRLICRKLEVRADKMATANQGDAGTYARALLRAYQDGLLPTVVAKHRVTHPDLYDRMLAAGVTPDFPRPRPARTMAWHGRIFIAVAVILLAIFLLRVLITAGLLD